MASTTRRAPSSIFSLIFAPSTDYKKVLFLFWLLPGVKEGFLSSLSHIPLASSLTTSIFSKIFLMSRESSGKEQDSDHW
jgi:hypothetical protein